MAKKRIIQRVQQTRKKSSKKNKQLKTSLYIGIPIAILLIGILVFYEGNQLIKKRRTNEFLKTIPSGFKGIGIDVSHHQGEVDWDKLFFKNHFDTIIDFVYCKATEGNTHEDREWLANRKWLNENGIPNGAYHFFITTDPPIPQVVHFLSRWKQRDIDLPPVLDVETEGFSDEDLRAKMKIWLNEVEKQTGMRPIIYTSLNFYETKFQNHFLDYKFWLAAYSRKPECLHDERIIHWQFTETGKIPGTKEEVDVNVTKISF